MRLLLTNDDGIDSQGLHVLARAMREFGEVVIVAPDQEYSGAGAAIGPMELIKPECRRVSVDGVDAAWSVNGPPALCVLFATLGPFGPPFDMVVSGINPGSNVGRSVYHSGTIGAALTARTRGISGVAVSQAVPGTEVEGQGHPGQAGSQRWETAAAVAGAAVEDLLSVLPEEPVVLNINVPNLALDKLGAAKWTTLAATPSRALSRLDLVSRPGEPEHFDIAMTWGDLVMLEPETDAGAVQRGNISLMFLGSIDERDEPLAAQISSSIGDAVADSAGRARV